MGTKFPLYYPKSMPPWWSLLIAGVSRIPWERFIVKPQYSSANPSIRGATVTFGAEKKSEKQRKMNTILKKVTEVLPRQRQQQRELTTVIAAITSGTTCAICLDEHRWLRV